VDSSIEIEQVGQGVSSGYEPGFVLVLITYSDSTLLCAELLFYDVGVYYVVAQGACPDVGELQPMEG
jgi:hypothetical protein